MIDLIAKILSCEDIGGEKYMLGDYNINCKDRGF